MTLLSFLLILLLVIPDLLWTSQVGPFVIKSQLVALFFYFLVFRVRFPLLVALLLFYIVLVQPFTTLGFLPLFVSFFLILLTIHRLRNEIYTESYLFKSVWVFFMELSRQVLLMVIDFGGTSFLGFSKMSFTIILNALASALLTIPLFLIWDLLFDFFDRGSRGSYGDGSSYIEAKPGRNELL